MNTYNQKFIDKYPQFVTVSEFFDRLFHSTYYLVFVSVFASLGHLLQWEIPTMFVLLFLVALNLATTRDITPSLITTILIALVPVAFGGKDLSGFIVLAFAAIYFVPAIVLRFIFFPVRFVKGKNLIPLLIYSVTAMLGGLGSDLGIKNYLDFYPLYTMVGIGFLQIVLYLFWLSYTPDGSDKTIAFFAKMMCALAVVAIVMVIAANTIFNDQYSMNNGDGTLPWKNYISYLLMFTMPFAFYFAAKSKWKVSFMLFGLLQYVTIVLSQCSGGLVCATVMLPFLFLLTIIKCDKKDRAIVIAEVLIIVVAVAVCLGLKFDLIKDIITAKLETGGSGRLPIYKHAIEVFKTWPMFGGGFGIKDDFALSLIGEDFIMMYYHSTVLQALAATGIVGFIGYAIMAFFRLKTYIRPRAFNLFLTIGFLGYAGYSMIDCGTVMPFPFCAIATFMLVLMEKYNAYADSQPIKIK